jgi:hypothetical protein
MLGHPFRDGAADALGGAGDDGDFALHVEQAHVFLPYGFGVERAYFDFRAKQSS